MCDMCKKGRHCGQCKDCCSHPSGHPGRDQSGSTKDTKKGK